MLNRLTPNALAAALQRTLETGLLGPEDTAAFFYDLDALDLRARLLKESFPATALHAAAIKSNPLIPILRGLIEQGLGCETASWGEVQVALAAGCPASRVVFDSPAKTVGELRDALAAGVHLNVDSFAELERVAGLWTAGCEAVVGVRINPEVGAGRFNMLSVATSESKFGIPLRHRERLRAAYLQHPWLRGVHLHVATQGGDLDLLARAVAAAVDFACEVNDARAQAGHAARIEVIDIGGGLTAPVDEGPVPTPAEYVERLRAHCPALLDKFRIVTEFGHYLFSHAGWAAARVEYVKTEARVPTAIVQVGADLLLRWIYRPDTWHYQLSVADSMGVLRTDDRTAQTVAGPLCFGGDVLAREVELPRMEPGDWLLIHDVGASNLSMWSRHCSRQRPAVIGYRAEEAPGLLSPRETLDQIIAYWGGGT